MKKINVTQLKRELNDLDVGETKKTIITNNAELYNDLITEYKQDRSQHNLYIIYQLNGMIVKQIEAIEKMGKTKLEESTDKFTEMVNTLKSQKKKYETR